MKTKLNRKGVACYAPILAAFLSLAFLSILGCGTHSLEDLLKRWLRFAYVSGPNLQNRCNRNSDMDG
ncbi:MAG: hypothetical protein LBH25_03635 [Fibromonadaceae bacterium]|nr:hypothetical protein [Fibromonadaceae bacterium]